VARSKLVVLVVEDEALIRITIADHLADVGYEVLEASSADRITRLICSRDPSLDSTCLQIEFYLCSIYSTICSIVSKLHPIAVAIDPILVVRSQHYSIPIEVPA